MKIAFTTKGRVERKEAQKKVTAGITEGKREYKKVEKRFEKGDMREAWDLLKIHVLIFSGIGDVDNLLLSKIVKCNRYGTFLQRKYTDK